MKKILQRIKHSAFEGEHIFNFLIKHSHLNLFNRGKSNDHLCTLDCKNADHLAQSPLFKPDRDGQANSHDKERQTERERKKRERERESERKEKEREREREPKKHSKETDMRLN